MKFFEKIKLLFSKVDAEKQEEKLLSAEEPDDTLTKRYDSLDYADLASIYTDDDNNIIIVKIMPYIDARRIMEEAGDWVTLTKNIISEYLYKKYRFNFEDKYSLNISKCSFLFKIKEIEFYSKEQILIDYTLNQDSVIFYLESNELYRIGNKNE